MPSANSKRQQAFTIYSIAYLKALLTILFLFVMLFVELDPIINLLLILQLWPNTTAKPYRLLIISTCQHVPTNIVSA